MTRGHDTTAASRAFGAVARRRREALGMTQTELGQALGSTDPTNAQSLAKRLESGGTPPTLDRCIAVAAALSTTLEDMLREAELIGDGAATLDDLIARDSSLSAEGRRVARAVLGVLRAPGVGPSMTQLVHLWPDLSNEQVAHVMAVVDGMRRDAAGRTAAPAPTAKRRKG